MAEKSQQELAKEAGKTLLTDAMALTIEQVAAAKEAGVRGAIPDSAPKVSALSPISEWRDNEPIKWNGQLAVWEYPSDGSVFLCSRMDPDTDARGH